VTIFGVPGYPGIVTV